MGGMWSEDQERAINSKLVSLIDSSMELRSEMVRIGDCVGERNISSCTMKAGNRRDVFYRGHSDCLQSDLEYTDLDGSVYTIRLEMRPIPKSK